MHFERSRDNDDASDKLTSEKVFWADRNEWRWCWPEGALVVQRRRRFTAAFYSPRWVLFTKSRANPWCWLLVWFSRFFSRMWIILEFWPSQDGDVRSICRLYGSYMSWGNWKKYYNYFKVYSKPNSKINTDNQICHLGHRHPRPCIISP